MANHEFKEENQANIPEDIAADLASVPQGDLSQLDESLTEALINPNELPEARNMLDQAPDQLETDSSLKEFEKEVYKNKLQKLKIFASLVLVSTISLVGFVSFKQSKLNASLQLVGVDPVSQADNTASALAAEIAVQSLLNQSLQSQMLAFQASRYYSLYKDFNSPLTSESKRKQVYTQMLASQKQIHQLITGVKSKVRLAAASSLEDETLLKMQDSLKAKSAKYQGQSVDLFSAGYIYPRLLGTLKNPELKKLFQDYPGEQASPDQLVSFLRKYFAIHNDSYLDVLAKVDLQNVSVLQLFNELEKATTSIDPNFEVFGSDQAEISFSNYNFSPENRTVSVSTNIRSSNPQVFTVLAQLYEKLSDSIMFDEVTPSNLAKTKSEGDLYSSSVTIALKLNENF